MRRALYNVLMFAMAFTCCAYERITGHEIYSCKDLRVDLDNDSTP